MNAIRATRDLNKRELELAVPPSASWHADYRDTAYVYIGGLPLDLSEGDVVTIFSQYGEPTHLNLVRDRETGKSRGFCFLKYEDQRSCDLAVDNLGGAEVLGRVLRVDHSRYKKREGEDEDTWRIERLEGQEQQQQQQQENTRGNDEDDESNSRRREKKRRKVLGDDRQQQLAITQDEHEYKDKHRRRGGADNDDDEDEDPMRDYLARERKHTEKDRKHRHHHHRHRSRKDDDDHDDDDANKDRRRVSSSRDRDRDRRRDRDRERDRERERERERDDRRR